MTAYEATFVAAFMLATGCSVCGGATPTETRRELVRVSEGDREIRVEATTTRRSIDLVGPGGRLPKLDRPGTRHALEVTLHGSIGGGDDVVLAQLASHAVREDAASAAELAGMDASQLRVEHCRDEGATPRVALRVRSSSDGALPGAPRGFFGVFLLENAVAAVRHTVEAEDCEAALAQLPADAEAWIRAELTNTAPTRVVRRQSVPTRGRTVDAREGATGTTAANGAAVAAIAEGLALDAVLAWVLSADSSIDVEYIRDAIPPLVEDHTRARAFLAMLAGSGESGTITDLGHSSVIADRVPLEIVTPEIGALATAIADACDARPPRGCSVPRVSTVAHLAARAADRGACTRLMELVPTIGREHEPGEPRGKLRLALAGELAGCAEPAAQRRAAIDLIVGADDHIGFGAPAACTASDPRLRLTECVQGRVVGATLAMHTCDLELVAPLLDAAPQAFDDRQREAIRCVLLQCAGADAAADAVARFPAIEGDPEVDPSAPCWPTAPAP